MNRRIWAKPSLGNVAGSREVATGGVGKGNKGELPGSPGDRRSASVAIF